MPLAPASRGLSRVAADGSSRRPGGASGCSGQIPELTVLVRRPAWSPGILPPLVKQSEKIFVSFLGSIASTDFPAAIGEESSAGHVIRVPVRWDLIRPAGKGDPHARLVNAAVSSPDDRYPARSIGHGGNPASVVPDVRVLYAG